jgi:hypothetical protein
VDIFKSYRGTLRQAGFTILSRLALTALPSLPPPLSLAFFFHDLFRQPPPNPTSLIFLRFSHH